MRLERLDKLPQSARLENQVNNAKQNQTAQPSVTNLCFYMKFNNDKNYLGQKSFIIRDIYYVLHFPIFH